MAETPAQPSTPARGTSPSPNIDRGSQRSWDSWHQHGNNTPQEALANKRPEVKVGGGE